MDVTLCSLNCAFETLQVNGNISEESNEEEAKYKQIILGLCAR